MRSDAIQQMKNRFYVLNQRTPDEHVARELMESLGYARRENFQTAIKRAIEFCETTGYNPDKHFCDVTKMGLNT
ncbi:hypothetical protein [Verminephrobacter eiseniae]|uniref:hypothetical protein n=1 Tax=Verminephrobacter eiseniae TaxID=364317 RepID=UPI0022388580|nr:hypothetical protein [Verminephrobacter eiseniae]MCW5237802.1 hypothetical protein [Verminephrobacter eiseniae]